MWNIHKMKELNVLSKKKLKNKKKKNELSQNFTKKNI